MSSCQNDVLATSFCSEDTKSCNSGFVCYDDSCCPIQAGQANFELQDIVTTKADLCPNGERLAGICATGCNLGYGCYQNTGCCRLATCPDGVIAISFCDEHCPGFCFDGSCCEDNASPQRPALPTAEAPPIAAAHPPPEDIPCPSGERPIGNCFTGDYECGGVCFLGMCCPMNPCPDQRRPLGWCSGNTDSVCSHGYCHEGTCCPLSITSQPTATVTTTTSTTPTHQTTINFTKAPRVSPNFRRGPSVAYETRTTETATVSPFYKIPNNLEAHNLIENYRSYNDPQCPPPLIAISLCSKGYDESSPLACPAPSTCIKGVCCLGQTKVPIVQQTTTRSVPQQELTRPNLAWKHPLGTSGAQSQAPRPTPPVNFRGGHPQSQVQPGQMSRNDNRHGPFPNGQFPHTQIPQDQTPQGRYKSITTPQGPNRQGPQMVKDLPICPSGVVAVQPAVGTWCPQGFQNIDGACCPVVKARATSRLSGCGPGGVVVGHCHRRGQKCQDGARCVRGVCCAAKRGWFFFD